MQGSVMMAGPRVHTAVSLAAKSFDAISCKRATAFLCEAASTFAADFGFVHVLTDAEVERGAAHDIVVPTDSDHKHYVLSVTTHQLIRGLPDLFWSTLFGPPYVDLFGRERLRSAPAHHVDQIGDSQFAIQLSDDCTDFLRHPGEVARRREALRSYLGESAFSGGSESVAARRPVFSLGQSDAGARKL